MSLMECLERARLKGAIARLRRLMSVRAMVAIGMSQRAIALDLGVSQPAVSQLLRSCECVAEVSPGDAFEAAVPVLKDVAAQRGFSDLAVFGSIARGEAGPDSDIDLIVRPPKGTQVSDLVALADAFSSIVGHHVDVMTYGGLKPGIDDDIRRDLVPL